MQKGNNITTIYSDIDSNYSHPKREEYLRFCANIKHFLGLKISAKEFTSLMKIKHINRHLLENGISNVAISVSGFESINVASIFVTLHLGCYNIIPLYLLSTGKKLCIPVTQRVYEQQVSIYKRTYEQFIKHSNADLKFVNIETASGFINLLRSVKNGYSILIYIDGNSGIGGMERKDQKLMKLNFFNSPIFIRKGVGFLSLKLGLDIVPVYTNLTEDLKTYNLSFMPSISHHKFETEEQITAAIWQVFKNPIFHNLEQWEPWLYTDSYYIQTEDVKKTVNDYIFNSERFAPIIKDNNFYFYDNVLNKFIRMKEAIFRFLVQASETSQIIKGEELNTNVSPFIKSQLISMHLLKQ